MAKLKFILCTVVYLINPVSAIYAQNFMNGSFELHSIDSCGINLTNDLFNISVENTRAFGAKNEIDLLSEPCGEGSAKDGDFFIALSNAVELVDEVSLELQEELSSGNRYAFTFFEKSGKTSHPPNGILIGASNAPDDFGELIYKSENLTEEWLGHYVEFTAPFNAKYITAKVNAYSGAWIFLDDFSKVCISEVFLGNDTILCDVNEITLQLEYTYDSYLWQDNSTNTTLEVNEPGLYWVEVTVDDCTASDSIVINEFPNKCNCEIYIPNAFSPNFDGINDELEVNAGCPFLYFELTIFNKWGGAVFVSKDQNIGWDGSLNGRTLNNDTFLYVLKYQFEYHKDIQFKTGDISLFK